MSNVSVQSPAILNKPSGASKIGHDGGTVKSILDKALAFDTVADMVAAAWLDDGMVCKTLGYYAVGDGGGNHYLIVPAQYYDGFGDVITIGGKIALGRSVGKSVNVLTRGVIGDWDDDKQTGTNTSPALQAAIVFGVANKIPLYFPDKLYRVNEPVNITGRIYMYGGGGFNSSCFVGFGSAIFSYASIDLCRFEKLSFKAAVAGCAAFDQTDLTVFSSNCTWKDCDFFYSLTECIVGNLILCSINDNAFGYHGPAAPDQTAHRHIYCVGHSGNGNTANINTILHNKFYNANGVDESCYFESGYRLDITMNTFETNDCRALTIAGMHDVNVHRNWFENNNSQFVIDLENNTDNSIGNYVVDIDNNVFITNFVGAYIASVSGSSVISSFNRNSGSGTFYQVTPGNALINEAKDNFFTGTMSLPVNTAVGVSGVVFRDAAGVKLGALVGDSTGIDFETGAAKKMRLTSAGSLIIGADSYIAGTDTAQIGPVSGTRNLSSSLATAANQLIFANPNGAVGSIQTSGVSTSYGTSSDKDLKCDLGIATSTSVIDDIVIHNFSWKVNGVFDSGVFAQDAYKVKPSAVHVGTSDLDDKGRKVDPWSVDYSKFVPDLIVYCKKLREDIDKLKINVT